MLTDIDIRILQVEADNPRARGHARNQARRELGLSDTKWNARVLQLLDDPDAFAHDPMTVYRLRKVLGR